MPLHSTHKESLPHVVRRSLYDKGMDEQGIVDVDEEGNFLVSAQRAEVDSFQLSRCTHIGLELLTLADALIVHMLYTLYMDRVVKQHAEHHNNFNNCSSINL